MRPFYKNFIIKNCMYNLFLTLYLVRFAVSQYLINLL